MEQGEIDFADASSWRLSKNGQAYVTQGSGLVACIFPSKIPTRSKYGGWIKHDRPDNHTHDPLRLVWGQTLREVMLDLELSRRKLLEQVARANTSEQA
ncbi:hypothetical protein J8F10_06500 [Gemmata sp. G18]|uniref:Uncharacterized protein n=1 Tax=Gemmata palustris TaxID=2822762 RepID=A0ABS5BMN4_9BACT|nr:hypothetical protein [Gemmata palustris]MBP3954930.1 hypothetical protein [Gemmata palustris]